MRNINAGVHAIVGFEFQRNSCLFLFLENYQSLKNLNYFISLEHYDDIIFAFRNTENELIKVSTFQAKKSSVTWKNSQLFEIFQKICDVGISLHSDKMKKSKTYIQNHFFISNNSIKLEYKDSTTQKKKQVLISESNERVNFSTLDKECQDLFLNGNDSIKFTKVQKNQFPSISLGFIDLPKNAKEQLELLAAKFKTEFGKSILDHEAARDLFLKYLKEIEGKYNQGGTLQLYNPSKMLESLKINQLLNVLTTKNLALNFCRQQAEKICEELSINIVDATSFELLFENSLDKFKDLQQGEHQKIIQFIELKKPVFLKHTKEVSCIAELFNLFTKEKNTALSPMALKAAIAAGYYLIKTQK